MKATGNNLRKNRKHGTEAVHGKNRKHGTEAVHGKVPLKIVSRACTCQILAIWKTCYTGTYLLRFPKPGKLKIA